MTGWMSGGYKGDVYTYICVCLCRGEIGMRGGSLDSDNVVSLVFFLSELRYSTLEDKVGYCYHDGCRDPRYFPRSLYHGGFSC